LASPGLAEQHPLVLGIPKVQTQVTIDGSIDAREWAFSSVFPAPHLLPDWSECDDGVTVRAQYDEARLYVAFEVERPASHRAPRVIPPDETQDFAEDRVHFVLRSLDGQHARLTGNADRLTTAHGSGSDVRYAVRRTPLGWQGELAVSARLGQGEALYFDFINEQATPFEQLSSLAYRKTVEEDAPLWKLLPRQHRPVLSFLPEKRRSIDRKTLWYELVNNEDRPADVETQFRFHKIDVGKMDAGTWASVEALRSETEEARWRIGRTSLHPYGRAEGRFHAGEAMGVYAVEYACRDGHGQLARGTALFTNQAPFEVALTPYYLTRNILELRFEMDEPPEAGAIEIVCRRRDGSAAPVAQTTMPVRGNQTAVGELSASDLEQNTAYLVATRLTGAHGELLAEKTLPLFRPADPPWHGSPVGTKAFVPPPWTPVELEGNTVRVWGREIILAPGLLPESIRSQGSDLLEAPAEWTLAADGAGVDWRSASPTIEARTPEGVTLRSEGDLAGASVVVRLRAEFDGFLWYDVAIEPHPKAVLGHAGLRIPLRASCSSLFHTYGEGTVRKSRRLFYETTPRGATPERLDLPFFAFVFLGNEDVGLQYCCESAEHWSLDGDRKALTIRRQGGANVLGVTFVDQKTALDGQVSFGFGLMPSPVKPLGRRHRFWSTNTFVWEGYAPSGETPRHFRKDEPLEAFVERVVEPWKLPPGGPWRLTAPGYRDAGVKLVSVYGWNPLFGACETLDPLFDEKFRRLVEATHEIAPDLKIAPYANWGVHKSLPFFEGFGTEMTRRPFEVSGWNTVLDCPGSSFADYFVDGMHRMIERYGVDGVYLDSTGNVPCCNRTGHGCGFRDADGNLHGTYPIRATREMFKRLYKVTHGETLSGGIVYLHMGPPLLLPIASFADLVLSHEPAVAIWDSLEDIGLDVFRATALSPPVGVAMLVCWHYYREKELTANQVVGYALVHGEFVRVAPKGLLHYASGHQAPGYQADKYPLRHVYLLMDEFAGADEVEFHPYWNNERFFSSDNPSVLGSFFLNRQGEALLVLCNLENEAASASVAFRFPSGRPVRTIRDPFLNTDLPAQQGRFEVKLLAQGYRLLSVKKR
jgi:hypothetical protein